MPSITQKVSQHVLTKHYHISTGTKSNVTCDEQTYQGEHKMFLNISWPNPSHASEDIRCISTCVIQICDTKCISTGVDQTQLMPQNTKNASQHGWSNDSKSISTCVDQIPPMPESTQNALKLCWPNPFHASEQIKKSIKCLPNRPNAIKATKCISTCVDQTPHMSTITQKASQIVLTKHLPWQRGQKMYLSARRQNPSQFREDTKCISTRVHQDALM